jgi:hypothetical protein
MAEVITDEMLDAYSVSATWDDLGPALVRRYGSLADRVLPYRAVDEWIRDPQLAARWQGVAETVRAG